MENNKISTEKYKKLYLPLTLAKLKRLALCGTLLVSFLLLNTNTFSQTLLINPATDGGFENGATFAANGWTQVGITAPTWYVGTAAASVSPGANAAFIGIDGSTYESTNTGSTIHFYKDVTIPAGANQVYLNFYLREPTADNNFDFFYVYTTTPTNTPVDGTVPGAGYTERFVNTATAYADFTEMAQIDLTSLAGTTVRLVFTLKNDGANPNANPAVDNVSLEYCDVLFSAQPSNTSACQNANANFIATASNASSYQWEEKKTTTWSDLSNGGVYSGVNTNNLSITGATATMNGYEYRCIATGSCSNTSTAATLSISPIGGTITASPNPVCIGSSVTLTAVNSTGSIQWQSSPDSLEWNDISGATASPYTSAAITLATYFRAILSNGTCDDDSSNVIKVDTKDIPVTPGTISGETFPCSGQEVYSIVNVPTATSYNWTVPGGASITAGDGTSSITALIGFFGGDITVSATNNCGTSPTNTLTIATVTGAPDAPGSITGSTSVCANFSEVYSVSAVTNASTYTWTVPSGAVVDSGQGATSMTTTFATTSGDIDVTASNGCGTSTASTITVTVDPSLTVDAGSDQTVCAGTAVTLTASGATSYVWDNGVDDGVAFMATATTTYTVTGAGGNGCSNTDTVIVTVNNCAAEPTASFTPSATVICLGESITFTDNSTGTSVNSWNWTFESGTPTTATTQGPHTIQYSAAGSYTVTLQVTDDNGTDDSTITITVNPSPTVGAGTDQTVCSGDAVTLTGSGATSYTWDNGVSDGVAFMPTATNTYTVIGTDDNGCSNTSLVMVTVNNCSQPTASFTPSATTICLGDSITFTDNSSGTSVNSWNWTFESGTPTTATTQGPHTIQYSAAGSYTVTLQVTDDNGTDDSTITITVNPSPTVEAGSAQAVCDGTAVTLTGSGATTYVWDNGVNNGEAFTPTATNTYTVTGTDDNGCSNTSQVVVTVNPSPTVEAGTAKAVCDGTAVTLTGSGATTYAWDNGVSDGVAFTPTATKTYTVTGTDDNGCSNTDTVVITVNNCSQPTASFTPSATVICLGESITFTDNSTGTNVNSWNWTFDSGTPTTATIKGPHTIQYSAAGTYTVTLQIIDDNGTDETTMTITVNSIPTASAGTDQGVCSGDAVTLSGSGATSYVWNNGVSDGVAFTPTATNTYTVTGTDDKGCSNTSQVVVTVTTVDTTTTVSGNTITANASPATYQWLDCGTGNSISGETAQTFTTSTSGNYAVIVTQNSCTETSSCVNMLTTGINETTNKTIQIYPNPVSNNLHINLGNSVADNITLTNLQGKIVYQTKSRTSQLTINLEEISKGVYFLKVVTAGEINTYKIIKE